MKRKAGYYNLAGGDRCICYIFMCIEQFLVNMYPDRDWTPIAKRMWPWTTHWLCDAFNIYSPAVPEFILEFDTYEDTNRLAFEGKLDKQDYEEIKALFRGITDGKGNDDLCRLLMIPIDFYDAIDNIGFPGLDGSALDLVDEIKLILQKHNIPLPEIQPAQEVEFDEKKPYYGDDPESRFFIYTEYLSVILNK